MGHWLECQGVANVRNSSLQEMSHGGWLENGLEGVRRGMN